MTTRNFITGIYEHSWAATLAHHTRLSKAARLADVHLVINRNNLGVGCVWPGSPYPYHTVVRKAGELPREALIADLRAYRAANKPSHDPLGVRLTPYGRKLYRNRLAKGFMSPSPFVRRQGVELIG